jgi:hypothetical protein
VIFFCACKDVRRCHRARVARLLLKAADRRRVRLSVVEWPGGEPKTISLPASPRAIRAWCVAVFAFRLMGFPAKTYQNLLRFLGDRASPCVPTKEASPSYLAQRSWVHAGICPSLDRLGANGEESQENGRTYSKAIRYLNPSATAPLCTIGVSNGPSANQCRGRRMRSVPPWRTNGTFRPLLTVRHSTPVRSPGDQP